MNDPQKDVFIETISFMSYPDGGTICSVPFVGPNAFSILEYRVLHAAVFVGISSNAEAASYIYLSFHQSFLTKYNDKRVASTSVLTSEFFLASSSPSALNTYSSTPIFLSIIILISKLVLITGLTCAYLCYLNPHQSAVTHRSLQTLSVFTSAIFTF